MSTDGKNYNLQRILNDTNPHPQLIKSTKNLESDDLLGGLPSLHLPNYVNI